MSLTRSLGDKPPRQKMRHRLVFIETEVLKAVGCSGSTLVGWAAVGSPAYACPFLGSSPQGHQRS